MQEKITSPTTEQTENDIKELDASFDYLCKMEGVKDAGHRWIEFSDKWNAFKKKYLSGHDSITRKKLACSLDEQQCRDSCDHKEDRSRCPFVTRREEVPEAVRFAEWIAQKHYYKDVYKEWYGCIRGATVLIAKTTAELFQLFKQQKP